MSGYRAGAPSALALCNGWKSRNGRLDQRGFDGTLKLRVASLAAGPVSLFSKL
jgi:hypothetical protein